MQLPSLSHITKKTTETFKRFSFTLISAFTAAVVGIYLIELSYEQSRQVSYLIKAVMVALLGIPLFTVIQLNAEKEKWELVFTVSAQLAGIILLVLYYISFPAELDHSPNAHLYRFVMYVIGLHLLVAVGPYLNRDSVNAFWQYNKTMFLRFLTAVLFTGVLFLGLVVALGAVEVLLEFDVSDKRYFQLFVLLGTIFNTWFFLAGIPLSINAFTYRHHYPKGLKVFTQNILIPLVIIYVVILYLYVGKIILQWSWPEGWVANLVLSFSIVGILALLLLHPIRDMVENQWIKRFSRGYFWALVPLVILLLLAIYRRIAEYGITIERYLVTVLGLWLTGIVIYFIISNKQNIKVIPASLCLLAFLISFGPWGAFMVSERNQIERLEYYLQKNDLLQNNSAQRASATVPLQDRKEISNIIRYLNDNHGLEGIQRWFAQDLSQLTVQPENADSIRTVHYHERPQHVVELMGIEYVQPGVNKPAPSPGNFYISQGDILNVQDVSTVIQRLNWSSDGSPLERSIGKGRTFIMESGSAGIKIHMDNNEQDSISVDLRQLIKQLSNEFPSEQHELPAKAMTFEFSSGSFDIHIYFNRISWRTENNRIILENVQFDVGIK